MRNEIETPRRANDRSRLFTQPTREELDLSRETAEEEMIILRARAFFLALRALFAPKR